MKRIYASGQRERVDLSTDSVLGFRLLHLVQIYQDLVS